MVITFVFQINNFSSILNTRTSTDSFILPQLTVSCDSDASTKYFYSYDGRSAS